MITKHCPECDVQVAIASKKCSCGHMFSMKSSSAYEPPSRTKTSSKRKAAQAAAAAAAAASSSSDSRKGSASGQVQRRRTSRVRREKPNYYDSLQYEKKKKKTKVCSRRFLFSSPQPLNARCFVSIHRNRPKPLCSKAKNRSRHSSSRPKKHRWPAPLGMLIDVRRRKKSTAEGISRPSKTHAGVVEKVRYELIFGFHYRLPLDKQEVAAIILSEINRKIGSVVWTQP